MEKTAFFSRFAACFWSVSAIFEKKFRPQRAGSKSGAKKVSENAKKNFGGLENGCIFAPAFDRGSGREKARLPGGKRTLKRLGR
ncbi:MAG: hypothetical protein IK126_08620 [Bacteroidales bacterium]|nr:hypothetical protein [Bacteroidales bacterium]